MPGEIRRVFPRWLHAGAKAAAGTARAILYPPICLLCRGSGTSGRDLCVGCATDLPLNHDCCRRCAEPLATTFSNEMTCGRCIGKPPPYERCIAPYLFKPPLDRLIHELKFHGRLVNAPLLGALLSSWLTGPKPDALLPVPLHPSRIRQRGFNQAVELARPIASQLGVTLLPDAVRRVRGTVPQIELPLVERRTNLRGAFALARLPCLDHVAIVDDVMTSGATVAELSRTLRAAGVGRIDIWVVARTPNGTNSR